jgi:hypothetical protein
LETQKASWTQPATLFVNPKPSKEYAARRVSMSPALVGRA